MLLSGIQPLRNSILICWPRNGLGISPAWLSGQWCLFLSKDCGALGVINPSFACWTCTGKGPKLLCVTVDAPFLLRGTSEVSPTVGKVNFLAHTGKKTPNHKTTGKGSKGGYFQSLKDTISFWHTHEKKEIMCASLSHWTCTFWIPTEEKKKSQTINFCCCCLFDAV